MTGLPTSKWRPGAAASGRPPGRWQLRGVALAAVLASLIAASAARPDVGVGEYELKAAFVVNFTSFVHWPPAGAERLGPSFPICVFGPDPFGTAFEPFAGVTVEGRPLIVRTVVSAEEVRDTCAIVFVTAPEASQVSTLLALLRSSPVLTVSDLPGFAAAGGMIEFHTRSGRIRFAINREALAASGLQAEARLLKLAEPAPTTPQARR